MEDKFTQKEIMAMCDASMERLKKAGVSDLTMAIITSFVVGLSIDMTSTMYNRLPELEADEEVKS